MAYSSKSLNIHVNIFKDIKSGVDDRGRISVSRECLCEMQQSYPMYPTLKCAILDTIKSREYLVFIAIAGRNIFGDKWHEKTVKYDSSGYIAELRGFDISCCRPLGSVMSLLYILAAI